MDQLRIRYWYNDCDLVPEDEDTAPYDLYETCQNYEKAVRTAIESAFLGAKVVITRIHNMTGYCRSPQVDDESYTAQAQDVAEVVHDVWKTFDWVFWV